jgi:tetratricopeptide (TPR) repeat protein
LFGLVVWTFLPAIHDEFINFDDDVYVTGNAHVQAGLSFATVAWAFSNIDASNWHPLTWLSHAADFQFFGLNPRGHHLTSVLLHAANAALLLLALHKLTGAFWRSLFVAAIFGLHPLRVESVAWVAERKDVLSTLFGLLALLSYADYAKKSPEKNSRRKIFYALALLFFACSLMSKPMLVTLPFLLLLLDYWPLARIRNSESRIQNFKKCVMEKIPFFLLAAASCAVTFIAQKRGGAMDLLAAMPLSARCENAVVSYCRYLLHFFWPEKLSVFYPVVDHWPIKIVLACAALLAGITAAVIVARRTCPYLLTGWLWFLGTLTPVIGLVAVGEHSMADRYTYFPLIGIVIIIAWGAVELSSRWRFQIIGLSALSAAIIVACIFLTRQNIGYWKDSETLFRRAIAMTGDNYSAHCNLGNALLNQGRLEEALAEFQTAVKLKPGSVENHCNVGVALADLNRVDEAIAEFQKAVALRPGYGPAHHDLGMAFEQKGQLAEATREYELAAKLMPGSAGVHNSLGVAFAKQNQLDKAIEQFQEAVRLDPNFVPAQNNLKMALGLKNH